MEESLRKLQTDYVDLLLIHWRNSDFPLEETLQEMLQLVQQGKTRWIGVSNFPVSLMEKAVKTTSDLVCDQVEYHPFLY